MFIPIGLDQDKVRRTPWISYGLIGINVLIFTVLWFTQEQSGFSQRAQELSRSVSTYLFEHP
jgi:hypothetical protein